MEKLVSMDVIDSITQNSDFITQREKEAIALILDSIQAEYKARISFELEKRVLFDSRRATKAILLNSLQEAIIEVADKKAANASIDTKGKYLTSYEERLLKRMFFISQIVDTNNGFIGCFLDELRERASR